MLIPKRKIIKGHKQWLRVTKWLLVRDVQIPNSSLGGEKKGINSTAVGLFLSHFRGGFELVTAASWTWYRRFWACLYPNSRFCVWCLLLRRGWAQVGTLISRRSWQQLQGGLYKMLHLQRDLGQKLAAFCSLGAFFCTFNKDLNAISRCRCDNGFNAGFLREQPLLNVTLGEV